MQAQYHPQVFDADCEAAARAIILTDEGPGADTDTRWARETPYLMELLRATMGQGPRALGPESLVLDYGCGIGRMAKAMIEAFGCHVLGVDISPRMRALAEAHVGSPRFQAVAPEMLARLARSGLRVDAAIAVWVLQHCLAPADDIGLIRAALAPGGRCFVLNMKGRAVPAVGEGRFLWVADGQDVPALLRHAFAVEAMGEPDMARVPPMAAVGAWWMVLRA